MIISSNTNILFCNYFCLISSAPAVDVGGKKSGDKFCLFETSHVGGEACKKIQNSSARIKWLFNGPHLTRTKLIYAGRKKETKMSHKTLKN